MVFSDQKKTTAIEWYVRLKSPNLLESEIKAFMLWLEESPEHQLAYIEAEHLWNKNYNLQIKSSAKNFGFSHRSYWLGGMAISATLLVLIAFSWLTLKNDIYQEFQTAIGEQKTIMLPDNSILTLNTQSKAEVRYTENQRVVHLLQGEAFFNIKKNSKNAFYVHSKSGLIRVYGTSFSVRQTTDDLLITVVSGSVGISNDNNVTEKFTPLQILKKNQSNSISKALRGTPPITLDSKSSTAWRNRKIVFNNTYLSEVIRELNRYTKHKIYIENRTLSSISVTAVIQLNQIENAAESLAGSLGLVAVKNTSKNIITLVKE